MSAWQITGSQAIDVSVGTDRDAGAGYAVTLERDGVRRQTTVYIARSVTDSTTEPHPDTQEAMRTGGKSAVGAHLTDAEPPRYITCSSNGCHAEQ